MYLYLYLIVQIICVMYMNALDLCGSGPITQFLAGHNYSAHDCHGAPSPLGIRETLQMDILGQCFGEVPSLTTREVPSANLNTVIETKWMLYQYAFRIG